MHLGGPCRKLLTNPYGLRFRAGNTAVDLEKERLKLKRNLSHFELQLLLTANLKLKLPNQKMKSRVNMSTCCWMAALSGDAMYIQKFRIYKVGTYVSTSLQQDPFLYKTHCLKPRTQVKHGTKLYHWRYSMHLGGPCQKLLPNPYGLCLRAGNADLDLEKER